ncbi:MAG: hypothetical protein SNJ75_14250 [Gemmataceae bacterium]
MALDDLAKEVGLSVLLRSTVLVMISTGEISSETRRYANQVMRDTPLSILLVDRADLERLCRSPVGLVELLQREASHAAQVKKLPQ